MLHHEVTTVLAGPPLGEPEPERSDVDILHDQLEQLDGELLSLVRRRTALAHRLRRARAESGATRFAHDRELSVVRRFQLLGPGGGELGVLLLRLAR
ncbi:chorismate mutase [Micromonospora pisi]|uniref:Chorismate mutase n=1 Tax=Micromonospora pisi TaxID=589240 RepID=A0A495JMZ0_9ACTN|nr:chorismate mutase [Micromonospora pisi]RKR90376.1 chorismate mutase [Micromonospora pisi]